MSKPVSILVYGRDRTLLETRCLLLQKTGSETIEAAQLSTARSVLIDRRPSLLILCHTVLPEEAEQILNDAATLTPQPQTIRLTVTGKSFALARRTEIVDVQDGPRALLTRVKTLLKLDSFALE